MVQGAVERDSEEGARQDQVATSSSGFMGAGVSMTQGRTAIEKGEHTASPRNGTPTIQYNPCCVLSWKKALLLRYQRTEGAVSIYFTDRLYHYVE